MIGAECIVQALVRRGVTHAFGMPGGVVLPLLEAMHQAGIQFVLVRDEASAGFMADAMWQITGNPGVCMSTLGPGATNLTSGLAGALLDRGRVIAITGQTNAGKLGVYTHQTLRQFEALAPLTKHAVTLTVEEAGREVALAMRQLDMGRPGPVLLNVPGEVLTAPQSYHWDDGHRITGRPLEEDLGQAIAQLAGAKKPLMAVGIGGLHAGPIRQLADQVGMPVITTYRAKGVVPEGAGWSAGAMGLSPAVDEHQQALIDEADLLIAVGLDPVELRPNWLPGWRGDLPMMVIDAVYPHDLLHPMDTALLGDISLILKDLADGATPAQWDPARVKSHRERIDAIFKEGAFGPAGAIAAVQRASRGHNPRVALDVGAHRITASHVWQCDAPGLLLQSNGLSTMGWGLPAAIACALVSGPAICITGDMGLQMALGELGVIQDHGLDVVVVVLRDDSLSLIELKQERMKLTNNGVRFSNPDVAALAMAFGGVGVSVSDAEGLEQQVAAAFNRGGLTVVEAVIDAGAYRRQM